MPWTGIPDAVHVLDHALEAVLDDPLRAIGASEPVIKGQLQAFLAGVIDIGEAQHLAGHFTRWVVATIFAFEIDARNTKLAHRVGNRRRQLPDQVQELAILIAGDALYEFLAVKLQCLRQARNLIGGRRQFLGIHPHGVHRRADRKGLAIAIGDHAAMRSDGSNAREALVAFRGVEIVLIQLQMRRLGEQPRSRRHQQAKHQPDPPAKRACCPVTRIPGTHGATILISWAGGVAMCRRLLATFSTKACCDQALCSSCN